MRMAREDEVDIGWKIPSNSVEIMSQDDVNSIFIYCFWWNRISNICFVNSNTTATVPNFRLMPNLLLVFTTDTGERVYGCTSFGLRQLQV